MIAIVGSGIGGLTTAALLEQNTIPYTLFDKAAELKPVGAGLIVSINAMHVFKRLGIEEEVYRSGYHLKGMNITTPDLKPMSTIDLTLFENKVALR